MESPPEANALSHSPQLVVDAHEGKTCTRSWALVSAARLIWAKRPLRPLRDELYGVYADWLVTTRSKRKTPRPATTVLPTLAHRRPCFGAHASGPCPPRFEYTRSDVKKSKLSDSPMHGASGEGGGSGGGDGGGRSGGGTGGGRDGGADGGSKVQRGMISVGPVM